MLKEKGYLDGLPQIIDEAELTRGQTLGLYIKGYDTRNSLLTHNVIVRLTLDGYVYMQNRVMKLEEHESLLATQKSTRSVNKWFCLTIIIASIGAISQIITLWNSSLGGTENKHINEQVQVVIHTKALQDSLKLHPVHQKVRTDSLTN